MRSARTLHEPVHVGKRRRSSRWRRRRYALIRLGLVTWRTLVRHEAIWHAVLAIGLSLFVAILIVAISPRRLSTPWWSAPILIAAAYAAGIFMLRFLRAWREFPLLRQEMRSKRMDDLRFRGFTRRRYEQLTFWRVTLPLLFVAGIAGLLISRYSPRRNPWHLLTLVLIAGGFLGITVILGAWNKSRRPKTFEGLCPRCGYNLTGTKDRCPECGMRRIETVPWNPYDWFTG